MRRRSGRDAARRGRRVGRIAGRGEDRGEGNHEDEDREPATHGHQSPPGHQGTVKARAGNTVRAGSPEPDLSQLRLRNRFVAAAGR